MTRHVRLFAVAYRIDLGRLVSYAAFRASIADLVAVEVVPHLDGSPPALVAFPEHMGLAAYLVGPRGADARAALERGGGAVEALVALANPYAPQIDHYQARFGDVGSAGQLLQLALTDTAVRAVVETFSALAAEHGVHVSVGCDLAAWHRIEGDTARALADPEASADYAYEATGPEVRNRNLFFGPDGGLVATHDKVHLVPLERDRILGLGLAPAAIDEAEVCDLGWGRVGTVTSKDAWMVDTNDRLEQVGVEVLVQPEAYETWEDPGEDIWPPDKLQRGGWWMVQKHPSHRALVMPVLVGRLGDLVFDGQPAVVVKAPDGEPDVALLGQSPEPGWAAVGGWDDCDDPRLLASPARRRDVVGRGVRGREGAVAADVVLPTRPSRAARPARAAAAEPSRPLPGEGTMLLPTLAADRSVIAAWVEVRADSHTVRTAVSDDGSDWGRPSPVVAWPARTHDHLDAQWHPRIAVVGTETVVALLGFRRESWDLYAVTGNGRAWGAEVRVDDAEDEEGVRRERGHSSPLLAPADGRLVALWSDLRWPWVKPQARWSVSTDGGRSWSASRRVDGGATVAREDQLAPRDPAETRGQAFPAAAVTPTALVVAWQELVPAGGPAIVVARLDPAAGPLEPVRRLTSGSPAAWRPVLAAEGNRVWLAYEEETTSGGRLLVLRRSRDGGRTWTEPAPLDPTPDGRAVQRHAAALAVGGGRVMLVFEDLRAGPPSVSGAVVGEEAGALVLGRLSDTPEGGDARVPAAARLADGRVLVAWQDTRDGVERIRAAACDVRSSHG